MSWEDTACYGSAHVKAWHVQYVVGAVQWCKWVALLPNNVEVLHSVSTSALCACGIALSILAFLPQSKHIQIMSYGHATLPIGV